MSVIQSVEDFKKRMDLWVRETCLPEKRRQLEVDGQQELTLSIDVEKSMDIWRGISEFKAASMHYSWFDIDFDGGEIRVAMSEKAHAVAAKPFGHSFELPSANAGGLRRNPYRQARAATLQCSGSSPQIPRPKAKNGSARASTGSRVSTGSRRVSAASATQKPPPPPRPPMDRVVVMPLCLDDGQRSTIDDTVPAFGGTISSEAELATHFLVPDKPEDWPALQRSIEKLPRGARVVHLAWLQAVLTHEGDPFDEGLNLRHQACQPQTGLLPYSPPAKRQKLEDERPQALAPEGSLQETWAFLRANRPEDAEAGELRVAIERSLLDSAIQLHTGRAAVASCAAADTAPRTGSAAIAAGSVDAKAVEAAPAPEDLPPEQILGVRRGATAEQLRAAYQKKALAAHPDKGGDSEAFCRVRRAYLSLSRGESGGEGPQRALQADPERCPDFDMKSHRDLVKAKFEEDGVDLAACLENQSQALRALGLRPRDLGATNTNEKGEAMYNQCFYLSLAHSFLNWDTNKPTGVGASNNKQIKEMALVLKRVIEGAVLEAHPDWGGTRVGEDVQAFSDFLFFALSAPGLLSEVGVAIFDACSGCVELYRGRDFPGNDRAQDQRQNMLLLQYVPGHYKALAPTGSRPTPAELEVCLESHGVHYVMTDV